MKLKSFLNKILDFLYYRKCYLCSKKCLDISICKECLDNIFSDINFNKIQKFNTIIYSGMLYEGDIVKIIRALKYHKKSEFAEILAEIIIKTIENYKIDLSNFIVCPVPIHQNRFKKRKYNHMELVAKKIAEYFNLQLSSDYLARIKDTAPLYKLSLQERRKIIKGAFIASNDLKDKKILLLDDIITSGSTINELSQIIQENEPQDFIVIAACRSGNYKF